MNEQVVGGKPGKIGWAETEERPQSIMRDSGPYLASNRQFSHNAEPGNLG